MGKERMQQPTVGRKATGGGICRGGGTLGRIQLSFFSLIGQRKGGCKDM